MRELINTSIDTLYKPTARPWPLLNVSITQRIQSLVLLAVSVTWHFPLLVITQRFLYSTYPVKGIACIFTQTFHYPTFQLLDVSALPF